MKADSLVFNSTKGKLGFGHIKEVMFEVTVTVEAIAKAGGK